MSLYTLTCLLMLYVHPYSEPKISADPCWQHPRGEAKPHQFTSPTYAPERKWQFN